MRDVRTNCTDGELIYSEAARCRCGAGLAYTAAEAADAWHCSDVLKGCAEVVTIWVRSIPPGADHSDETRHDAYEFWCWTINAEDLSDPARATTRRKDG